MFKLIFIFIFVYILLALLKNSLKKIFKVKNPSNIRDKNSKNEKDISSQAEVLDERRLNQEDK